MITGQLIWARRWKHDDNGHRALDLKLGKQLVARIWTKVGDLGPYCFYAMFVGNSSHKGYRTQAEARKAIHRHLGLRE